MTDIEAQAKEYWEAGEHQALTELIEKAIQDTGLYSLAQEEEHRGVEVITILTFGVPPETVERDSQCQWCLVFQKPGVRRGLFSPPLLNEPEYIMCYHTGATEIKAVTTVNTVAGVLAIVQSNYKPQGQALTTERNESHDDR